MQFERTKTESICKSYGQSKVGQTKNGGHKKGEKIIISKVFDNGFQMKELVKSFLMVFVSSRTEIRYKSYDGFKFKQKYGF